MSMVIEADELVDNIGDWTNHIDEVRRLTFRLTKAMLRVYLSSGHDVVLPYLVLRVEEIESIALDCNAGYYEVVLHNERADAITRLLTRGRWGEATSPSLTEKDLPVIEEVMTGMEKALEQRPSVIKLQLKDNDPDTTYSQLLQYVEA